MKFNTFVTSDQSQNLKRHFNVPSHIERKIRSTPLYKELRPIWKDDEIRVVCGHCKDQEIDKVVQVYRKKYVIYIEHAQYEKADYVGIHPSKIVVTRLKLDNYCKKILEHKAKS
ncbi:large ribosomal subunit protein uL24-like [Petaurus breviceps papuanus]|uniref:large ribosomal subunit protein uL24-like n=1 Tax=Petaurus breviceps papuanus TaxID=3040969 RepID=UPI0036DA1FE5